MFKSRTTRRPLLHYAVDLLAKKKYSVREMRGKLVAYSQKFAAPLAPDHSAAPDSETGRAEVEKVINRLLELKYLNDLEYTGLFIDEQLRRAPQGIMMLKKRLAGKGLEKELVERALQSHQINEPELAQKALQKKLKVISRAEPKKMLPKLYRFLLSRGFSSAAALQAIEKQTGQESFF